MTSGEKYNQDGKGKETVVKSDSEEEEEEEDYSEEQYPPAMTSINIWKNG